jgi:hypothetical protein
MIQECPVCSRSLRLLEKLSGCCVMCKHCRGCFVAADSETACQDSLVVRDALLHRVDELLGGLDDSNAAHSDTEVL